MKHENLIKIPLQFFGESEDDFDDDLDYEDEDEVDYDEASDDEGEDAETPEGGDEAEPETPDKSEGDDHADLVADLKALGFKGDDLNSIKASVKARRAAREKNAAAEERAATLAAGKSHVKGSKPTKSASGDGMDGFTERDLAEINACLKHKGDNSKQRARVALESVTRTSKK